MKLSDIKIGESAFIKKVNVDNSIKRRLLDIGITPGTKIKSVLKNFNGNLTAYSIKGTLIAIREEEANNILVRVCYE